MTRINVEHGGAQDGWPNTLGTSEHNGSAARGITMGSLERGANHLIARRKFVTPGLAMPTPSVAQGRLCWYVPVAAFTEQGLLVGRYSTDNEQFWNIDLYVSEVLVLEQRLPPTANNTVIAGQEITLPFSIGSNSLADMREVRVELTWSASAPVTWYALQIAQLAVDNLTV